MSQKWNLPLADSVIVGTMPGHINDVGQSLQSKFSGTSAPTGPVTGQWWIDTTTPPGALKIYTGSVWVTVLDDISSDYGGLLAAAAAAMAGDLNMANNKIVNLDDGTDAGDALNKSQIDGRALVLSIPLGTLSATAAIPILCGGPAMTLLQVSMAVGTTVAVDLVNYWNINLFNYNSDGSGSGSEIGADILATDFSTHDTALTAFQTNDLGSFETEEDILDANDYIEFQATKVASAPDLENALLVIKYKITTA